MRTKKGVGRPVSTHTQTHTPPPFPTSKTHAAPSASAGDSSSCKPTAPTVGSAARARKAARAESAIRGKCVSGRCVGAREAASLCARGTRPNLWHGAQRKKKTKRHIRRSFLSQGKNSGRPPTRRLPCHHSPKQHALKIPVLVAATRRDSGARGGGGGFLPSRRPPRRPLSPAPPRHKSGPSLSHKRATAKLDAVLGQRVFFFLGRLHIPATVFRRGVAAATGDARSNPPGTATTFACSQVPRQNGDFLRPAPLQSGTDRFFVGLKKINLLTFFPPSSTFNSACVLHAPTYV